MEKSVIQTDSLTKYYGKVIGVKDLFLEVKEGEIFGFLGPNGAGKTTTLRLLMGLLFPTGGRAWVLGMDPWEKSVAIKDRIGYLSGEVSLYERFTGERHIEYIAGFNGRGEVEGKRLAEVLELDLSRKVKGYSRGMKQKLGLILALMKRPSLLIMDEPTSSLDPLMQRALYEILREYRDNGTTIMLSSHNLFEVERICDRVGIIREGHLVATERIDEVRSKRLRHVEVIFTEAVPSGLSDLPGVVEVEETGKRVRIKLRGDINPLLQAITAHEIADLSVTHARLEDVFLEFYSGRKPGC